MSLDAQTESTVEDERQEQLLSREIEFVGSEEFRKKGAYGRIMLAREPLGDENHKNRNAFQGDAPIHRMMRETRLLTFAQEQYLFRKMNYLLYLSKNLRYAIDEGEKPHGAFNLLEHRLREANDIRNRIIKSNLPLVVNIAKKFTSPQYSLEWMASEGTVALYPAVRRFDYMRRLKFSTLAWKALIRRFSRHNHVELQHSQYCPQANSEFLQSQPERDPPDWQISGETRENMAESVEILLMSNVLDAREREILERRNGLNGYKKPQTQLEIGGEIGISKQRIHQIEKSALNKLRKCVAHNGLTRDVLYDYS